MDALHAYHAWMFWLQEQLGGDDILHVNVGMAIWLATVLLRQTSLRDRTNLLPLLALEIANEIVDFIDGGASWTLGDTIMDIVLSLMWPILVTEIARRRAKTRIVKKLKRAGGEPGGADDERIRPDRRRSDPVPADSASSSRRSPVS